MTKAQDIRKSRFGRMLHRAGQDPLSVLEDARFAKPRFCRAFLELGDTRTWEGQAARDYVRAAEELARRSGDRHLRTRSLGVVASVSISWDFEAALAALCQYLTEAESCCADCVSDARRRVAEVLVGYGDPRYALVALLSSIHSGMDREQLTQVELTCAASCLAAGFQEEAMITLSKMLANAPLDLSPNYFLDAVTLVALVAAGKTPSHERLALDHLVRFKDRIRGMPSDDDWKTVRTHISWVEGLLYARLDDPRRAYDRLESARQGLLKTPLSISAVAVTLDLARLLRHRRIDGEAQIRAMKRLLGSCLRQLKLDVRLRRRLERVLKVVTRTPEKAARELRKLRASLDLPMPRLKAV